MDKRLRWLLLGVCLMGAIVLGLTARRLIDSPLRFDESDFPFHVEGILRHGVPKFLYAESNRIALGRDREFNGGDARYGMWHPPLYFYSLAGLRAAVGPANWAYRATSALWFVLTAALIARYLSTRVPAAVYMWTCIALVMLCPIILHGMFFVDIDNSSLACALVLYLIVWTRAIDDYGPRQTATLTAVMVLALWSKLSTPYILWITAIVFHALNRNARGVVQALIVGAVATAAFYATYFLYCAWTGYPSDFMFHYTYVGKRGAYLTGGRSPVAIAHALWWTIVWFSPALTVLAGLMTVDRVRGYLALRRLETVDAWLLFAWACFGAYSVWAAVMGKYVFPGAVSMLVAIGLWLPAQLNRIAVARPRALAAAIVVMAAAYTVLIPPLMWKDANPTFAAVTMASGFAHPRNIALIAAVAMFGVFAVVVRGTVSPRRLVGSLALAMIVCAATANTVDSLKIALASDDVSPYRPFREHGFAQLIDALNSDTWRTQTLIGPKDVGLYYDGKSYALENIIGYDGPDALRAVLARPDISIAVQSSANPITETSVFERAGFTKRLSLGDYVVFRR